MAIQDNSPTRTYIRWSGIKLSYEGMVYAVRDGHTNNKYIYWNKSMPNNFQGVDILPYSEENQLIIMNNDGVAVLYPTADIIHDGGAQQGVDNTTLAKHISNQEIHLTVTEKESLLTIKEDVFLLKSRDNQLTQDIGLNANSVLDLKKRFDKIELTNTTEHSAMDKRLDALEEENGVLKSRLVILQNSNDSLVEQVGVLRTLVEQLSEKVDKIT